MGAQVTPPEALWRSGEERALLRAGLGEEGLQLYSDIFEEVIARDAEFGPMLRKVKTVYDAFLRQAAEKAAAKEPQAEACAAPTLAEPPPLPMPAMPTAPAGSARPGFDEGGAVGTPTPPVAAWATPPVSGGRSPARGKASYADTSGCDLELPCSRPAASAAAVGGVDWLGRVGSWEPPREHFAPERGEQDVWLRAERLKQEAWAAAEEPPGEHDEHGLRLRVERLQREELLQQEEPPERKDSWEPPAERSDFELRLRAERLQREELLQREAYAAVDAETPGERAERQLQTLGAEREEALEREDLAAAGAGALAGAAPLAGGASLPEDGFAVGGLSRGGLGIGSASAAAAAYGSPYAAMLAAGETGTNFAAAASPVAAAAARASPRRALFPSGSLVGLLSSGGGFAGHPPEVPLLPGYARSPFAAQQASPVAAAAASGESPRGEAPWPPHGAPAHIGSAEARDEESPLPGGWPGIRSGAAAGADATGVGSNVGDTRVEGPPRRWVFGALQHELQSSGSHPSAAVADPVSRLPNGWAFGGAGQRLQEAADDLPREGFPSSASPSGPRGPLSWADPPDGDLGDACLGGGASLLGAGYGGSLGGEPTRSPEKRNPLAGAIHEPQSPERSARRSLRYSSTCDLAPGGFGAARSDEEEVEPRDLHNASWSTDDTGMLPQRPRLGEVLRPLAVPRLDLAVVAAAGAGAESGEDEGEEDEEEEGVGADEELAGRSELGETAGRWAEASRFVDGIALGDVSSLGSALDAAVSAASAACTAGTWGAECLSPEVPGMLGHCGSLSATVSTRAASTPPYAVATTPTPPYAGRSPGLSYETGCEGQSSPAPMQLHLSPPW